MKQKEYTVEELREAIEHAPGMLLNLLDESMKYYMDDQPYKNCSEWREEIWKITEAMEWDNAGHLYDDENPRPDDGEEWDW